MSKHIEKILTKLGLETEAITKIIEGDEEINVDEIAAEIRTNISEALKNDDAFIAPIRQSARGEVLSSKERKMMKQFGVAQEEYDALPDKTKFDSLIELCASKQKPSGTSEEVKAEIQKLRSSLSEKDETIKKLTEEEIPAIKSQVENERKETKRQIALRKALKDAVGDKKLLISEDAAFTIINSEVGGKYDIKLTEEGLTVWQKGKENLEAFDENNKRVKVTDAFLKTLEAHNLIQKSNAGGDPPPRRKETVEIKGRRMPPGLTKHIENMKEKGAPIE